ncbi:glycogen/starch synthase [Luteolibacter arcticus]|uniref:starch synthase n=1 Tax=Luteolibacter arcticus TaxID=1581411 RepID=A0ABT3GGM3_9BACT|nr:glycogen/starch synthase [Luteolibacter arcticus]MCW1922611.1 glycogen/starch synthase [Luteolibacter arcticus]
MSENPPRRPRILVVTPEITYLPEGMGNLAQRMCAKAGGLADVSASLVKALYDQGADVHVALPNYRRMFHQDVASVFDNEFQKVSSALPEQRIHLAQDRVFYHRSSVYGAENHLIALAFQREVINHTLPQVRPDLIHCNDWMTGLIPAVAKQYGIKSLFTVHNIHSEHLALAQIEDRGIDAAAFWQHCYFRRAPWNYEESRANNPVDLLTTGILSADHVNTVSPTFLEEIVHGSHHFIPDAIRNQLRDKYRDGRATGILNAPDPVFDPASDPYLKSHFTAATHAEGKRLNKLELQERLGLMGDPDVPLFFWPSRLDPVQKGCQLLGEILHDIVTRHRLQIAIVASGAYKNHFHDIVNRHRFHDRVAVRDFDEGISHLGYAASDFIFMPSSFEPCGLPQMIAPKYGSLTLAHDTGGLHDTVDPFNAEADSGNGFLFQHFNGDGLRWAVNEAMTFYHGGAEHRAHHLARIMKESAARFNHEATAAAYIKRYEQMLETEVTA